MCSVQSNNLPKDPGAQPERTLLAWQRTGLSLALNGFLLMRNGMLHSESSLLASGLLAIVAAGLSYMSARRRLTTVSGRIPAMHGGLLGLTICSALQLCALGAWHEAIHYLP